MSFFRIPVSPTLRYSYVETLNRVIGSFPTVIFVLLNVLPLPVVVGVFDTCHST